jgi:hypothetical protein
MLSLAFIHSEMLEIYNLFFWNQTMVYVAIGASFSMVSQTTKVENLQTKLS